MEASGPPPPGGDVNKGSAILAPLAVTIGVATMLVILRLYVRARMLHSLWWDDFFIVVAMVIYSVRDDP